MTGDAESAIRLSEELLLAGIAASAIRTPTVPANASRVRFSLSSAHSGQELQEALSAVMNITSRMGMR
jgi:8-amino-7-oxononanoate synthase